MMQPIWNKQELHLYKLAGGSLKKAKYFSFIKISIKKAKYFSFLKISIKKAKYFSFIKISIQLLSAKLLGLNETSPI